jgi:hypothetical protein
MQLREAELYHQVHPAKVATDGGSEGLLRPMG